MKEKLTKNKIIILALLMLVLIGIYQLVTKEKNIDITAFEENVEASNKEVISNTIIVHIAGEVNNEGIYELAENSRIADAIDAAGGLTENAVLDNINLASFLEDGCKIYIPKKEDEILENKDAEDNNLANKESKNLKININTASQKELETLPGIGTLIAKRIIEYRKVNGRFSDIEEIKKVNGIGESKFKNIKDFIKI